MKRQQAAMLNKATRMSVFYTSVRLPPYLAKRKPYMGEFLFEGFVHVLLEVGGFHVFNDRSLKRKTRGGVRVITLSALSKVTGSLHPSVGFHCFLIDGIAYIT